MTLLDLPLASITPDTSQPRSEIHDAEVRQLADSIASKGQLLPIRVRKIGDKPQQYKVVSGHRRLAAMTLLGRETIKCFVVEGDLSASDILEEQLVENLQRSDLTPLDEARGYQRFLDLKKCTASEAAKALAISSARISRALSLLTLPSSVQDAVQSGQLSPDAAYYLTRLPAGHLQTELIEKALQNQLSRDEAARAAKKAARRDSPDAANPFMPVSRVSCPLLGGRVLTISGASLTIESFIETLEEVLRDARKARSQNVTINTMAKLFRDRADAERKAGAA